MNAKTVFSTALALTLLSVAAVRAQPPGSISALDTQQPPMVPGRGVTFEGMPTPPAGQQYQLSSWVRGDKYECCDGVGGNGPIQTEIFSRVGPALTFGNGTVADVLQTGLYVGAGARSLFFDQAMCNAWTVELGIANVYNHAHLPGNYPGIPLNILVPNPIANATPLALPVSFGKDGVPGVTLREVNRTFVNMGGGHEWYIWGAKSNCGPNLRVGCDFGGRWGSESADFNEIRHRTDVIGGLWAAGHTDIEIPCGCCVLQAGLRVEYGYTWSDILQIQNKSDVQDIFILFNFGVRF